MTNNKHILELLPAYALGSLDEDELLAVSKHLGTCKICQKELNSYEIVVDQLTLANHEYEPSENIKKDILGKIQQEVKAGESKPISSNWLRTIKPAWGFISVLLILLLGVTSLSLWQQVNQLQTSASERDQQEVFLQSGDVSLEDAMGVLLFNQNSQFGTLIVEGLPALEEGYQYQLWLIRDGVRESGGVFSVSLGGYGFLTISSSEEITSYEVFGVTVEPTGGSSMPTGEKVLGSDL